MTNRDSFFQDRTIKQRIQYLERIEQGWDEGVRWADGIISELQEYDPESEGKKAWTSQWDSRWKAFVRNKEATGHGERVLWGKNEWCFFARSCQGRSLVTGQVLERTDCHIDRIFNSDGYTVRNCLLMEGGLNFAKGSMPEFQTSSDFTGECKLEFGVRILRRAVRELLEYSRPHRDR